MLITNLELKTFKTCLAAITGNYSQIKTLNVSKTSDLISLESKHLRCEAPSTVKIMVSPDIFP